MVKKAKTRPKTDKVMTYKKLKTQIRRTRQMFLRRFQQVAKESCDKGCDSDRVLLPTRNTRKLSSKKYSTFSHANIRNEDTTRDSYTCYRCQHFLEIPHNLSRPFSNRISTFVDERCKVELNFIQAIVWLKSAIACVSQIPVEQLQQIFDKQWNAHNKRHRKDEYTDVEQLRSVDKDLLVSEKTSIKDTLATSTPVDISDVPCITPQRTILYARSEDIQSKLLSSMSANDMNQLPVEFLILESSNSCHSGTREKEKEVESSIIPETDVESIQSEDLNVFNSVPEHQSFEFEKDIECSVQSTSKSGIEQINKKIVENKHILQKSHIDVTSESILSRNQSVDPFDLENNFNGEFTSMKSQNDLADKELKSNGSPKSFIITPKDISQMSNNNDEYFKFLFNDNSSWQMSNTIAENSYEDSAYSTSRNDIFNYDTTVEAEEPITSNNKRLLDSENYYELQPCKKKTIMYETEKVSPSTNGMLTSDCTPKSLIITQKDVSQILDVYTNENSEFQIVSDYNEQMSDIFENLENDTTADMAMESISNKCTPNIEQCYELHPYNKETITCEKMMASASIIQRAVIPDTNIKHRYNLQACNNRQISREKEAPSTTVGGLPKERQSERVRNLLERENENKMISADWLNFTLESLRVEYIIIESIKVILSTLCDKKMVEEYMIKEQRRNMRNYWKGSLEEEAINAILNISDIFITEKKPNICINVIMSAIIRSLNEMTMRAQLNNYFTETSIWIYRVQIILEFCNSLPICVKVINYLLTRLKSLQSVLINVKNMQKTTYIIINQLHLVFYALNIVLQKYRTIIPNDQRSRSAEKIIPHVADLWKIHYIHKELEYTDLDLDAAEKRWLNVLENSAIVFTKHFVQFAEKSLSLVHLLISQSSTRIT